jgi:hypothetical protein
MDVNLQSRKIAFVQAFLKLEAEHSIDLLEKVLEKEMVDSPNFSPMSIDELNSRIAKSEKDYKDGKYISQEELEEKYK